MRKITRDEILRAIWESRDEAINCMIADGRTSCQYRFENFLSDMLSADILSDRRTIQTKWDMLVTTGAIRESGKHYTNGQLAFLPFTAYMDRLHADLLRSTLRASGGESERERYVERVVA